MQLVVQFPWQHWVPPAQQRFWGLGQSVHVPQAHDELQD